MHRAIKLTCSSLSIIKITKVLHKPQHGCGLLMHEQEELIHNHAWKHAFKHQDTRIQD